MSRPGNSSSIHIHFEFAAKGAHMYLKRESIKYKSGYRRHLRSAGPGPRDRDLRCSAPGVRVFLAEQPSLCVSTLEFTFIRACDNVRCDCLLKVSCEVKMPLFTSEEESERKELNKVNEPLISVISMTNHHPNHLSSCVCVLSCRVCFQKLKKTQANGTTLNPEELARLDELKVSYFSLLCSSCSIFARAPPPRSLAASLEVVVSSWNGCELGLLLAVIPCRRLP
jgi:hypothetical protein